MSGACCYFGVCCPPGSEKQAIEVLAFVGGGAGEKPVDTVRAILGVFRLVPLAMDPVPNATSDAEVAAAQKRLAKLNKHLDGELKAILLGLGHEVEEKTT